MLLSEMTKGQKGTIVAIDANKQLRDRLMSLGLMIGEEIEVIEFTLMRQTFKILAGDSFVAIRQEEAERIFVKAI
jgi:ferrous iron transport protein A